MARSRQPRRRKTARQKTVFPDYSERIAQLFAHGLSRSEVIRVISVESGFSRVGVANAFRRVIPETRMHEGVHFLVKDYLQKRTERRRAVTSRTWQNKTPEERQTTRDNIAQAQRASWAATNDKGKEHRLRGLTGLTPEQRSAKSRKAASSIRLRELEERRRLRELEERRRLRELEERRLKTLVAEAIKHPQPFVFLEEANVTKTDLVEAGYKPETFIELRIDVEELLSLFSLKEIAENGVSPEFVWPAVPLSHLRKFYSTEQLKTLNRKMRYTL